MYEDENFSGMHTGDNTSGVYSGAQNPIQGQQAMGQNAGGTDHTAYFNHLDGQYAGQSNQNFQHNDTQSAQSFQQNNAQYSTYNTGSTVAGSQPNPKKGREKKHRAGKAAGFGKKALLSVSLGLCFGLFAGLGFYAVQQATGMNHTDSTAIEASTTASTATDDSNTGVKLASTNNITVVESDISNVVDQVMPAMVSIVNNYTQTSSFFGQTYTQDQAASGSGIIVSETDSELLIVTNHHVVADATTLQVTFIDGSEAEAKIKGMDSDMDLAVIAVPLDSLSDDTKNAITVATLGDSDNLKLGEPVIAIGNALGYGQSVTNGIVSALNREITLEDGSTGTFIQTNAAINPGNSGGALLNINGEVIGINSNKIGGTTVEGMGYAIPISSASPIIADLMEHQTREKVADGQTGYLGISLQEVNSQISQMYDMPQGICVMSVEEGSAAQAAGIMKKDIITKFDGEKISSYSDLQNVLQYYAAGDTVKITVMRPENGEYVSHELEITLGSRPEDRQ